MSDDDQREQILERLRAGFRLEMTSAGRFIYDGSPIDHPRVVDYFRRHIACDTQGRPALRAGDQTAPLRVCDCSFRVRHVEVLEGRLLLELDDGRKLAAQPRDLRISGKQAFGLFALVRPRNGSGQLSARFNNHALSGLAPHLQLDEVSGAFSLKLCGTEVRLPPGDPPESAASW